MWINLELSTLGQPTKRVYIKESKHCMPVLTSLLLQVFNHLAWATGYFMRAAFTPSGSTGKQTCELPCCRSLLYSLPGCSFEALIHLAEHQEQAAPETLPQIFTAKALGKQSQACCWKHADNTQHKQHFSCVGPVTGCCQAAARATASGAAPAPTPTASSRAGKNFFIAAAR